MIFASSNIDDCCGAVLAHDLRSGDIALNEGHLITPTDMSTLTGAGVKRLYIAQAEVGEITEALAATSISERLVTTSTTATPVVTGRVNVYSNFNGTLRLDEDAMRKANGVHEAISIATREQRAVVRAGQRIASVKVIPFFVNHALVAQILSALGSNPLAIAEFPARSAAVVATHHQSVPDPGAMATNSPLTILFRALNVRTLLTLTVPHNHDCLVQALQKVLANAPDITIVVSSLPTIDRRDVVPEAIGTVGGEIFRFGFPVDPGNLTGIGEIAGTPVVFSTAPAGHERHGLNLLLSQLVQGHSASLIATTDFSAGGLPDEPLEP